MRLLCPNCSRAMTVPETQAGQTVLCERCNHSFSAPEIYQPAVEIAPTSKVEKTPELSPASVEQKTSIASAPDPVTEPVAKPAESVSQPVPATPEVFKPLEPVATAAPLPAISSAPIDPELQRLTFLGIKLPVKELLFVGPVALSCSFFLLFFTWVAIIPGGKPAYTQTGWQTIFAEFSFDELSEQAMELRDRFNDPSLRPVKTSWWTVIHLLVLLISIPLAWGDCLLPRIAGKLPELPTPSPRVRLAILAGLSFLLFVLVMLQYSVGFGLHGAAQTLAVAKHKEEMKKAIETNRPLEARKVEILVATDTEALRVRHSSYLKLDVFVLFIAAIAFGLRYLTFERGSRPDPRIGIYW
jgi:hypothetical protein